MLVLKYNKKQDIKRCVLSGKEFRRTGKFAVCLDNDTAKPIDPTYILRIVDKKKGPIEGEIKLSKEIKENLQVNRKETLIDLANSYYLWLVAKDIKDLKLPEVLNLKLLKILGNRVN